MLNVTYVTEHKENWRIKACIESISGGIRKPIKQKNEEKFPRSYAHKNVIQIPILASPSSSFSSINKVTYTFSVSTTASVL